MRIKPKIDRKRIIIMAAADLFREKGYNASSVRDIAAMVGLEPSSIYSHIKSKEELLAEICLETANKFMLGINIISKQDISAKKMLKLLVSLHLDIAFENPSFAIVYIDEWRYLPEPILSEFLNLRKDYDKKFKKILTDGKSDGKFSFLNSDIAFNIIIKTLNWSFTNLKKFRREEVEEELNHLIFNGI
ncbi:MAG: TetR family transcriptional regulator [Saprospiraceae bacterium]|nr:TetR family transcriptional regulator [Saprospiraceae bacterium]